MSSCRQQLVVNARLMAKLLARSRNSFFFLLRLYVVSVMLTTFSFLSSQKLLLEADFLRKMFGEL